MILTQKVKAKVVYQNVDYYNNSGLEVKIGDVVEIKPEQLSPNSNIKIEVCCDKCGKEKELKYQNYNQNICKNNGKYYCNECAMELVFENNLKKYGTKSPYLSDVKRREEDMMAKYGYRNPSYNPQWGENFKKMCQEKYGVDNVFQLEEVKQKSKQTNLKNYGTEYPRQNKEFKERYLIKENNPAWIDGRSYKQGHSTTEIEEWRNKVFARDNYTCQCCGYDKGKKLNAHHLNSKNMFPEQIYIVENGITLCKNCHKEFHHLYGYGNNTKEQFENFMNQKSQETIPNGSRVEIDTTRSAIHE